MLEDILQSCLAVLLVQATLMRSLQRSTWDPCVVIQFQAPAASMSCMHASQLLHKKVHICCHMRMGCIPVLKTGDLD